MTIGIRFTAVPLFCAALAGPALAESWQLAGTVVGVSDGDTITLLDDSQRQHKIRLDGIDAPEKGQAFGQASKRSMSELAFSKAATAECSKRDRYGREVCLVLVAGQDVGLIQLDRGMAWVFTRYERELPAERRQAYRSTEAAARAASAGLWADPEPVPPWEARKVRSGAAASP